MNEFAGAPAQKPPSADQTALFVALVPLGILLNLSVGTLVQLLKVPLFIDAIGTILVTILLGTPAGVATGVISFLLGGILINPVMAYFAGSQAAIAIYVGIMGKRGFFKTVPRTILTGLLLGVIAAIVAAPVVVKLFGGITGNGTSLITGFFLASGKSVLKSVFLTGVSCEPVDKVIQCLLVFWLLRSLPRKLKERFVYTGTFQRNFCSV